MSGSRIVTIALLLTAACALADDVSTLDPYAAERIEHLLADAEVALAARRLTTPAHDNAFDRYLQVLAFLPDDPRALRGLQRIADAYFGMALGAAERRDAATAERMFELGRQAVPDHPAEMTVRRSIDRLLVRPLAHLELDPSALETRSETLAERLQELGGRAKEDGLLAVIVTPEDTQGRWVYQQMNAAPPAIRLRARTEPGAPARVELRAEP